MPLVKLHKKGQITLPVILRRQARIDDGDVLEARMERGRITLTPKSVVDRRIAASEKDYRAGRSYGPFESAEAMAASIERELKKRAKARGGKR